MNAHLILSLTAPLSVTTATTAFASWGGTKFRKPEPATPARNSTPVKVRFAAKGATVPVLAGEAAPEPPLAAALEAVQPTVQYQESPTKEIIAEPMFAEPVLASRPTVNVSIDTTHIDVSDQRVEPYQPRDMHDVLSNQAAKTPNLWIERIKSFFSRQQSRTVESDEPFDAVEWTGEPTPIGDDAQSAAAGLAPAVGGSAQAPSAAADEASGIAAPRIGPDLVVAQDGTFLVTPASNEPDFSRIAAAAIDRDDRYRQERLMAAQRKHTRFVTTMHEAPWWMRLDPSCDPGDVAARKALASTLKHVRAPWSLAIIEAGLASEDDAAVRARLLGALVAHNELLEGERMARMMREAIGRSPIEQAAAGELGFHIELDDAPLEASA